MVLDDSSSRESDDFSEHVPNSDRDPYDSSSNKQSLKTNLPKPIPVFGSLFGYTDAFIVRAINTRIQYMAQVIEREPTADEASAMAYWTARQISITSYGQPIGIAGGWWRAYNTWNTFRFPFWQPNPEKFSPAAFPSVKKPYINGPRAILAWHASRVGLYAMVGSWIGGAIFGSYALSVAGVGEVSDKRLREYVEAIRRKAKQSQGAIFGPQRQPSGGGAESERVHQRSRRHPVMDDASPTSGAYGDSDGGSSMNMYGLSQDENTGITEPQRQQREPMAPAADNIRRNQVNERPRNFDEDFDDASPTGGRGAAADTIPSGGSTWDRIRKQAATHPPGSQNSSWPSGAGFERGPSSNSGSAWNRNRGLPEEKPSGDSYTFSSSEEDRQLSKAEAQKVFDDRVERERQGGDFSSGSGDQRRW